MSKAIFIGAVEAVNSEVADFAEIEVQVHSDVFGAFSVSMGAAHMDPQTAARLARHLMGAAAKAETLNLMGSVSA